MRALNKYIFISLLVVIPAMSMAQKNPRNIPFHWQTDTTEQNVPLDQFTVMLERDAIPPIDSPSFWKKEAAGQSYFLHEPVIVIEIEGNAKAYPLSVLNYHEIVNDRIGDIPVSVTYCPLCNAALVFDRRLDFEGQSYLLDFGVSGMLRKSDLVMWDRQTESWWQQLTGTALVGKLAGARLSLIPSMVISLKEFFDSYPDGRVLSTETGHFREYGTNPYTGYDNLENQQPRLFEGKVDPRLPAMERVISIEINDQYKIYPFSEIREKQVINDRFEGIPLVLFYTSKAVSVLDQKEIAQSRKIGSVTVFYPESEGRLLTFRQTGKGFVDQQTGSVWSITGKCSEGELEGNSLRPVAHGNHFAFAWLAFHPDSEIYGHGNEQ